MRPPDTAGMRYLSGIAVVALLILAAGCGSGSGAPATATRAASKATTTAQATTTSAPAVTGPGALQAEATAAAAGDIPDNQIFLTFRDPGGRFSMKYPEGWAQQGSAKQVTFRDKNNVVRIVIGAGRAPTASSVRASVAALPGATAQSGPLRVSLPAGTAFKVVYRTVSAPNPVTGQRVVLSVDRYYLSRGGRTAVVDLGASVGVDNVDAYRMMIESFRWS